MVTTRCASPVVEYVITLGGRADAGPLPECVLRACDMRLITIIGLVVHKAWCM